MAISVEAELRQELIRDAEELILRFLRLLPRTNLNFDVDCPNCNRKIIWGQSRCQTCGLTEKTCDRCGTRAEGGAIICPVCTTLYFRPKLERIRQVLYDIYNTDPAFSEQFENINHTIIKQEYRDAIVTLNNRFKNKLRLALESVKKHEEEFDKYVSDWIQIGLKHGFSAEHVTRRMYLNCDPDYIDVVVKELLLLILRGIVCKDCKDKLPPDSRACPRCGEPAPQIIFKFPNPDTAGYGALIRADKIVVYYSNDPITHRILKTWVSGISRYLHPRVPLFTKKMINGVGFAYEPELKHHEEIAYAYSHKPFKENYKTSLGEFITFMAAEDLFDWFIKADRLPNANEIALISQSIAESVIRKFEAKEFKFISQL